MDDAERFWSRVDKNGPIPTHRPELGPCWVWTGSRPGGRYGQFKANGQMQLAHRFAFQLEHGALPPMVCHHCDNQGCVRHSHLFAGNAKSNLDDMAAKGRSTRGRRRPGTGPSGMRNRNARINDDTVAEIRRVREVEKLSIYQLAERFSISKSQAFNIVSGKQRA